MKRFLATALLALPSGLLAIDTDGDGLDDSVETNTGVYVSATNTGTNPLLADSDGDGAGDWYEVTASFTNPNVPANKPNIPYPLPAPGSTPPATNKPVKVFILSGQSNMVGQGNIDPLGTPGTLATITRNEHKFTNLLNGSGWSARNDVTYRGVIAAVAKDQLKVGQGSSATAIGPELGFGHVMGYFHDEPVLLLKSSQGGRALGWDFLPPGSVQYTVGSTTYAGYGDSPASWATGTTPVRTAFYAGYQYDQCFLRKADWAPAGSTNAAVFNVTDVLDNFATQYPQYAAQGFEIAGFVWWQGWNDGLSYTAAYANRYETNMAQFIRQIRSYYERRYPGKIKSKAPFVLATCAFGGWDTTYPTRVAVANAQLAVSNPVKYPEFAGNVKTMEARNYWRDVSISPANQNYHYNRNAETFMLVGDALGRGMIDLLNSAVHDTNAPVFSIFSPADNATNVAVSANLVLTFNESIALGTGNITLKNLTDVTQSVIAITSSQVTVAGSVLTINPTANLTACKSYAVRIDATAIKDLANNSFAGLTNDTTWNFTVTDNTPPTVSCPAVPDASADATCQSAIPAVAATANDACPGMVTVRQNPLAGTPVGLGTHTITVTATDAAGNSANCTTTFTVTDNTPPVIHCPSNITVEFTSETGAVVTYSVAAADNCDAPPVVTCVPPSGSQFPIGATTVNCTATDAANHQISCSFTVTVLGARGTKENVIAELIALRATVTDPEDGRKLDEAIEHLTKSLAAELWMDQTHLERKHGDKVFHEEKETVKKLCELIKSRMSNIPDAVLEGFADRLFRADRLLASVAIQEAVAAGVAKKKIDQARKELAKGDAETGDDKCANGIEDYKNAWKHAVRPKVSPPIAPTDGRLQLDVLGEPGERFTIQVSSNLVDWVTLGICTANAEGVVTFEDADDGRHPVRYYRAVSP